METEVKSVWIICKIIQTLFSAFSDRSPMYDNMKLWNEVRRAVLVEGLNHHQACQKFGIHDDTLKKMLAHAEPPGFRLSKPREKRVIGPFLPIIKKILKADQNVPKKQRHHGDYSRVVSRSPPKWKPTFFVGASKIASVSR